MNLPAPRTGGLPPRAVYILLSALISGVLLWRVTGFALDNYVNVPFSDIWGVVGRYQDLLEGRIGLFDYIFMRHGDHPHAVVYFLSFLDFSWFSGKFRSLQAATLIFTVISNLVLLAVLLKDRVLPAAAKFWLSLVVAAFLFNASAMEMWVFPFQVVVASVRVFFVAALALIVFSLYAPPPRSRWLFVAGLGCALLAAVAHGSGFLIFPAVFLITLTLRRFKAFFWAFAALLGYFAFTLLVQGSTRALGLHHLLHVIAQDYQKILEYAMVYLGSGLLRLPQYDFAVGIAGFTLAVAVLLELAWRAWKKPVSLTPLQLFFGTYLLVSGGSAFLATTLHFSIGHLIAGYSQQLNSTFFTASRYFINTSAFWLSLVILLSEWLSRMEPSTDRKKVVGALSHLYRFGFVPAVLLLLSGLIWQSQRQIASYDERDGYSRSMREGKAALKAGVFDREAIDYLFTPAPPQYGSVAFLQKQGLSLFSENGYPLDGRQSVAQAHALTGTVARREMVSAPQDAAIEGFGNGLRVYGYFSEAEKARVRSEEIYLIDESRQLVGFGAFSPRAELIALTAENFDNAFYFKMYPDVAAAPQYQPTDGGWRHWNEFGKKEKRLARPLHPTAGQAGFIGFVPQAYASRELTAVLCEQPCLENPEYR